MELLVPTTGWLQTKANVAKIGVYWKNSANIMFSNVPTGIGKSSVKHRSALWLATERDTPLIGPLECDKRKVRQITFQVFPFLPNAFYGLSPDV